MPARTINWSSTLAVISCCNCGVLFGVPVDLDRHNRALGRKGTFWCPNGHSQCYTENTEEKFRKELAAERQRREWAESSRKAARDQAEAAQRSASAYKGQVTKIKKRVGNGVCPCCNRTFANVARHMNTKHPDYRDAEVTETSDA
jgi:hypothetical protein